MDLTDCSRGGGASQHNEYLAAISLACRRERWLAIMLALLIVGMLAFGYLSLDRTHL